MSAGNRPETLAFERTIGRHGRSPRRESETATASRKQFLDNVAADVGQPLVAAVVQEGELLVVEAHQVQDRGVDIVDMGAVFDRP